MNITEVILWVQEFKRTHDKAPTVHDLPVRLAEKVGAYVFQLLDKRDERGKWSWTDDLMYKGALQDCGGIEPPRVPRWYCSRCGITFDPYEEAADHKDRYSGFCEPCRPIRDTPTETQLRFERWYNQYTLNN